MEDRWQIFLRFNRLFVILCQKLRSGEKNIAICHGVCWEGNLWCYQPEQEAVANSLTGIRKDDLSITQGAVWPGGAESTGSNYLAGLSNIGQTFKGPKIALCVDLLCYAITAYKVFLFQTALQDRKAGSSTMEKQLRFQNLFYILAKSVGITPLEDLGQKWKVLLSGNRENTFSTKLLFWNQV